MFQLDENGTNVRTEVLGGVTTFMTMAYIVFVNPQILSQAGMDFDAVMTATCLSAGLATWAMGLAANYPIALAPGMGENLFFVTVVVGMGVSWQVALAAVFVSGLVFFLPFSRCRPFAVEGSLYQALPSHLSFYNSPTVWKAWQRSRPHAFLEIGHPPIHSHWASALPCHRQSSTIRRVTRP